MGEILKTKSPKAYAYASGGATSGSAETPLGLALDSAASLVSKAFALVFAALIAAIFFAGSAYADSGLSGSIPDNDVDASGDDATMIYESGFTNKVYTITNGGTYKLGEDITDGQIKVAGNATGAKITLDLNGCSLSSKTSKQSALYIYSDTVDDVVLNVVDSKNSGSIVQGENTAATAVRIGTGYYRNEVTLGNVKIVSKDSGCQCVAVSGCNLTIDGATLQTENGTAAELIYAINTSSDNVCGITLNSGTFRVASDASGLFKFDGTAWGYPSFTLNGGTYNKIPISENLGDGKIVWKTDEGYTIGDAAKKPSECKYLVALSQKKELWFTSEAEAESFTKSSEAGGVSFHKVSFAIDADKSSVDVPVQYIADGLCAIEPEAPSSDGYKFNYWKSNGSEYDFETKVTADLTLTADWSLYVAQVVGADKFTSVEEAVSEAPADGTVELLQDIESQVNLTGYSRAVTIDLKGHTIKNTESGRQAIMVLSPKASVGLTITDSGNASGAKGAIIQEATNEGAIRVDASALTPHLILSGVEIKSVKTECLQMIKGSAELNDVKMSVKEQANSLIYTETSLKVNINGGTYTAADGMALITEVSKSGETVLNGGVFNIFPANGTLAEGKALLKKAGSSAEKGYFEVVDTKDIDFSTIAAEVEYSSAKVYFEDEDEAASFADSHEGATFAKCVTAINESESLVYDGKTKEVQVKLDGIADGDDVQAVVKYSGGGLVEDKPVAAGSYTAEVTGLSGNDANKYTLRNLLKINFEIQKASTSITIAEPGAKTIGDEFKLNPSAFDGASFTYESSDSKVASVSEGGTVKVNAAGTATITVNTPGDSNHTAAAKSVILTAKAADFSAAKVILSKTAFTYNGKAQKPSVKSVVLNGKTLKAGTDYTASIASGKKVGTYNVTIAAKGSYTGKATASFVINPKGVAKFKVTKAKKAFKAKWKKSKTERSGVQVKYSTKKSMKSAKTVKAKGASVKAKKVKKLKKKTKYYVQVRAYKVVNGKTYYSSWSAKKAVKTK